MRRSFPLVLLAAAVLVGCSGGPPPVDDELTKLIADFRAGKPEATAQKIDALMAGLDKDIADAKAALADKGPSTREQANRDLQKMEARRDEFVAMYASARLVRFGRASGEAARQGNPAPTPAP